MKRLSALFLALLMALSLCACGGSGEDTAALGKYNCTSISMNDIDLEGNGEWLELQDGGKVALYVGGETHSGTFTLEENTLSMTIDGQEAGSGTLENGVLTMDILGATCVFQQETAEE